MGGQYHYTLETQACYCEPTERGLRLSSATQVLDLVQVAVAQMLRLGDADVLVETQHVGGAYGGKAEGSVLVACACALVAKRLGRPARLQLPMPDNMRAMGKRFEFEADYELGVDADGRVQYLDVKYYCDCGCRFTGFVPTVQYTINNLYASDRFHLEGYSVYTDKAPNTSCRGPGTVVVFWNAPRPLLSRPQRKLNKVPR